MLLFTHCLHSELVPQPDTAAKGAFDLRAARNRSEQRES